MSSNTPDEPKSDALKRSGTMHPHPDKVSDELFLDNPFFDPRDGLQVKYEMLRRVRVDGHTVSQDASSCGLSRPTYYQAAEAFDSEGMAGLLPEKKGPKRAHKLSSEVLDFVDAQLQADPELRPSDLAQRIQGEHGIEVHPKSIPRARTRRKKKQQRPG